LSGLKPSSNSCAKCNREVSSAMVTDEYGSLVFVTEDLLEEQSADRDDTIARYRHHPIVTVATAECGTPDSGLTKRWARICCTIWNTVGGLCLASLAPFCRGCAAVALGGFAHGGTIRADESSASSEPKQRCRPVMRPAAEHLSVPS
jgi:hypothetical protein